MSDKIDTYGQEYVSANLVLEPELTVFRVAGNIIIRGYNNFIEMVPSDDPSTVMWAIAEQLVSLGSRYDAKRLRICMEPGDKHHDYHPKPCSECECQCDVDQSAWNTES